MNYFILLKFILIFCLFMPLVRTSPRDWPTFHDNAFVAFVENEWDQNAAFEAHKSALRKLENFNPSHDEEIQDTKMLEPYFGVMYLMKQNWHCGKIRENLRDNDQAMKGCEKYSKFADIIYEFLFQVYAKKSGLNTKDEIIKPTFIWVSNDKWFSLTFDIYEMLIKLSWISKYFFDEKNKKHLFNWEYEYERMFGTVSFPELRNGKAFFDSIKTVQKEEASAENKDLKTLNDEEAKEMGKNEEDNFDLEKLRNGEPKLFAEARKVFDKKLEEFAKNAIEMVANDKEMAKKAYIVRKIWQGHPFLKMAGKKAKESLLQRAKHAIQSVIAKKGE